MPGKILIIAEAHCGKLKIPSLEVASKAVELARPCSMQVVAVVFGETSPEELKQLAADRIILFRGAFKTNSTASYPHIEFCRAIGDLVKKEDPDFLLAAHSNLGRSLLPYLAQRLSAAIATDCVGVFVKDGKVFAKRFVYGGRFLSTVRFDRKKVALSIRPKSFPVNGQGAVRGVVEEYHVSEGDRKIKVVEVRQEGDSDVDLSEADRIVAAGRSIGSAANFAIIEVLAKVLHAQVGASRAAVDAGFISLQHQVGQTGRRVGPSLYIACGISGAIQHMAGMRTSKVIVAINKDKDAPIFSKSDYGIVGDMFEIVPLLAKELERMQIE